MDNTALINELLAESERTSTMPVMSDAGRVGCLIGTIDVLTLRVPEAEQWLRQHVEFLKTLPTPKQCPPSSPS